MENTIKVPIVTADDVFTITNPNFMVGGPLQDGNLQVDMAEDFMKYGEMAVIGEPYGDGTGHALINPRLEFPGASLVRRIVGRIKLSPTAARQLAHILLSHADAAETAAAAMADAAQAAQAASKS